MVLTRNSCISENYRASKRILRDIKHQQQLRPRVSIPNYREESPDEIAYYHNILKVNVKKKKSLSHKLRITSDNASKTYKEIHRYELRRTSNTDNNNSVNIGSVHDSGNKSDAEVDSIPIVGDDRKNRITSPTSKEDTAPFDESKKKTNNVFGVNKCQTAFKRRLSSSFAKHSDMDNSQLCYDNGRRYPIRLRRRPAEVYMVNSPFKSGKKPTWHDSISSPIQGCFDTNRHRKLEVYSKQSDTDDSDDEIRFDNRKQRSMIRARAELNPINMDGKGMTMDLFHERNLARSSLADIEPMTIDKTVNFAMIGGNKSCIQALKESVILPLVYPEVFEKLSISPPRGLLFYGPPGSGKTLMARALVNECSNSGNCKIAFFMRKGADCLSKWVGESERQLRLLFDQAYRMRPSIIFFDEIDGLAPVRSARQDQIHSSIVSTLLSLIDGLDDRGDIIVIGATNRLDSIDPALRRPGRFDREFLFSLPEENVRQDIIRIHTRNWQHPVSDKLISELACITKGYSGADLKGLVIEAGLCAIRRRYPQIYKSQKKLQLNIKEIFVKEEDFRTALKSVRPSSERSGYPVQCKFPQRIRVLIELQYNTVKETISTLFQEPVFSREYVNQPTSYSFTNLYKLRLLITGYEVDSVVSGLFHDIHNVTITSFDSLSLGINNGLSTEEKLSHMFREAQKSLKSIIFLQHLDVTFHGMSLGAQNLLLSIVRGTIPNVDFQLNNVLILVTLSCGGGASKSWPDIEFDNTQSENIWRQLGEAFRTSVVRIDPPDLDQRVAYFNQLKNHALESVQVSSTDQQNNDACIEEVLTEVEMKPKTLSKVELDKLEVEEDNVLRKFRMLLRKMLVSLAKERKFQIFHNPVDESDVPDYYKIVTNPMDLSTMRQKVDLYNYNTFDELKKDLHLISANALLYNPPRNSYLKDIRRHAYEFLDIADSIYEEHFNSEFAKMVSDIHQSRLKRQYYEKKKVALEQQSGELREFLTDLNGSKYEMNNGPLLKSQIDMYRTFYFDSVRQTKTDARAHSDSETIITRTSLRDSLKCRSMSDITDINQSNDAITMTLESFRAQSVAEKKEDGNNQDTMEVDEASLDNVVDKGVPTEPIVIDMAGLDRVISCAAMKCELCASIFQMETLYCAMVAECDKYRSMSDRGGLVRDLEAVVDRYHHE